jgi:hypothetical protein
MNAHIHPCLEWDSNPTCQRSSEGDSSRLRPRGHCDQREVRARSSFNIVATLYIRLLFTALYYPNSHPLPPFRDNPIKTTYERNGRQSYWRSFTGPAKEYHLCNSPERRSACEADIYPAGHQETTRCLWAPEFQYCV